MGVLSFPSALVSSVSVGPTVPRECGGNGPGCATLIAGDTACTVQTDKGRDTLVQRLPDALAEVDAHRAPHVAWRTTVRN